MDKWHIKVDRFDVLCRICGFDASKLSSTQKQLLDELSLKWDLFVHYVELWLILNEHNIRYFKDVELSDEDVFKLIKFQNLWVCFYNNKVISDCLEIDLDEEKESRLLRFKNKWVRFYSWDEINKCLKIEVDGIITDEFVENLISGWESNPNPFRGFMIRHGLNVARDNKFKKLEIFINYLLKDNHNDGKKLQDWDKKLQKPGTVAYFFEKFSCLRSKITDEEFEIIFNMNKSELEGIKDNFWPMSLEDFRRLVLKR